MDFVLQYIFLRFLPVGWSSNGIVWFSFYRQSRTMDILSQRLPISTSRCLMRTIRLRTSRCPLIVASSQSLLHRVPLSPAVPISPHRSSSSPWTTTLRRWGPKLFVLNCNQFHRPCKMCVSGNAPNRKRIYYRSAMEKEFFLHLEVTWCA